MSISFGENIFSISIRTCTWTTGAPLHCTALQVCNPLIFWECGHEMCHRFAAVLTFAQRFSLFRPFFDLVTGVSFVATADLTGDEDWRRTPIIIPVFLLPPQPVAPNFVTRANGICILHTFRNVCWLQLHLQSAACRRDINSQLYGCFSS